MPVAEQVLLYRRRAHLRSRRQAADCGSPVHPDAAAAEPQRSAGGSRWCGLIELVYYALRDGTVLRRATIESPPAIMPATSAHLRASRANLPQGSNYRWALPAGTAYDRGLKWLGAISSGSAPSLRHPRASTDSIPSTPSTSPTFAGSDSNIFTCFESSRRIAISRLDLT
jgi:hypothetical protein